ncbi:uncharacterized protein N7483_006802 [Penicillium malachiteum]|uniref:uncharacterized protein n=1 Tax=Penicillium malachiteum TaxID=1324776 RepID=UPI0025479101|nr:uncharacterized protein N7483_006802 [Penicillium malachiteum]KAJ5725445.1 hypothetical protein N7483_006802 [Penicillium malachiteum]
MNQRNIEPCWTCRNRRIQCDQTCTPCKKCQKAGLECFDKRPFRWVKGVAIRGNMRGRSFQNNTESSSEDNDNMISVSARVKPATNSESEFHSHLHFNDNERICKLFIVYDSDRNPFRSLIPLGLKDPVLLKSLLALAARHHVNTGRSFHYANLPTEPGLINANRDALSFKHQSIEALSRSVQHDQLRNQDTTVASIFLLIFLDLIESGGDGWNFHLEGVKKLITSLYSQSELQAGVNYGPGETVQEIRGFITNQIHLIETLGATFLRPKLLSQFSSFGQQELQLQETVEKSFLGCPEYILTAIQCLSVQRDSISSSASLDLATVASHIRETEYLMQFVQNFDCYAWASNLQRSRNPSAQEVSNLCILSQSYKLGTLLYGRRILDALIKEESVQDELISELLGLIDSLKDDPDLFKCILWPVFVAGLECKWQAQRDFLIGCLERFWTLTSCLNAVNAAKILRDHWQEKDSESSNNPKTQWIFDIGKLGRDWLWI